MSLSRFKEDFNFELNDYSLNVEFEMLSDIIKFKVKDRKLGLLS